MKLPNTATRIPDSKDYIDIDGSVYTYETRTGRKHALIKKTQRVIHGYSYCGIYSLSQGKPITRRVHRLVASAFIPNPENLPVVGHKNNIKNDNRVENLYWTTISENTQKAVDDGLLVNAKGYDDSQSKPVKMFDTFTNRELGQFGSISEAALETGLSQSTIARQARYKRPVRRPYYFRFADDEACVLNQSLIAMYDYKSDKLVSTFINISQASSATGIAKNTIKSQCNRRKCKPPRDTFGVYFSFLSCSSDKCEQTIETR